MAYKLKYNIEFKVWIQIVFHKSRGPVQKDYEQSAIIARCLAMFISAHLFLSVACWQRKLSNSMLRKEAFFQLQFVG